MWVHDERRDETSLIAQVVAKILHERHELSSSFFSSNTSNQNLDGSRVIPTLAYQLTQTIPQARRSIIHNVSSDLSIFKLDTETQLEKLVVEPLTKASPLSMSHRFIIIHGLEDFEEDFQRSFLHAVSQALTRLKSGSHS